MTGDEEEEYVGKRMTVMDVREEKERKTEAGWTASGTT